MCGDICTHRRFPCICGDTALTYRHTQHHCCLPPGDRCTIGYEKTECSSGTAVHRSEPCHGVCNEDTEGVKTDAESCGYTDKCGYDDDYYMCGDICTYKDPCSCGGATLDRDSPSYCCTSHGDHCSYDWNGWWTANPRCSTSPHQNAPQKIKLLSPHKKVYLLMY